MEKIKFIFPTLFLIAALTAILFFCMNFSKHEKDVVENVVTVLKTDTVYKCITIPNVIIYRDIPPKIDTLAILTDYFAKREYLDTIVCTPEAVVTLQETVENNRITDRSVSLQTFQTIIHTQKKNNLYLSADIGRYPSVALTLQRPKLGLGFGYLITDKSFFIRFTHKIIYW